MNFSIGRTPRLGCCLAALIAAPAWAVDTPPSIPDQLSLRQAEDLLRLRNRDIMDAQRNVRRAQADRLAAAARPNPTLSVDGSDFDPTTGLGAGPLADKRLTTVVRVEQTLERGDKRGLRMKAAEQGEAAATLDLRDAVRTQLLALRQAYYDLHYAQERTRLLRESSDLLAETRRVAATRLKLNDIAEADVARIEIDALRAEVDAQTALSDQRRAQQALATLLAAEEAADRLVAVDPWPTEDPVPLAGTLADQIAGRPDVRAARQRIAAADATRSYAHSLQTRDVTLGAQYQHSYNAPIDSVGLGVSFPLMLGYRYDGEIARAETDYAAAEDALERTRGAARTEIDRTLSALATAKNRLERYQRILPSATKVADATEFAFRRGAKGVLDVIDARRVLRATQLDALSAQADYAKALAAWQAITPSDDAP